MQAINGLHLFKQWFLLSSKYFMSSQNLDHVIILLYQVKESQEGEDTLFPLYLINLGTY